ncbi:ABC transporter substrate-binding protein [Aquabacterium fontiphilum]|uniref:ABC transporter substrate-binding protein n=1 Tax=Aquabacterium fontiphilum TaxID=450365 RepID=UPI00137870CD|nr:ABC transporter substrate-binding protein [Aquabacterium fontiphilum]NBD21197.1 ABC transporter substrate-binding protein [Aquabacterium fontiphilum]
MSDSSFRAHRRHVLQAAAAMAALGTLPRAQAQSDKILIGYWPIASGLPLYAGLERGIFKEAGLNVEGVKFQSAQQVAEAMITGRIHGSANGTASAVLALAEITSPGLFKIICSNPSNHKLVLDQFVVPIDSTIKSIAELKGKRVGSGPGIQNVTLTKLILEKNGVTDARVVELPIGQHVPSLAAGQLDAVYTLEPTGTAGRLRGLTRVLENGVISKYILGNADAPWFGGSASVTSTFLKEQPDLARRYVAAYARAVDFVRKNPTQVRQHLDGFTSIDPSLVNEVPLAGFTLYNEFTESDLGYFQKFFDVFTERKIFSRPVPVKPLIYTA